MKGDHVSDHNAPAVRPRLSVIIPFSNARETLGAALHALAQNEGADFEIICVDDRSDDDSAEIALRYAREAIHIGLLKRSGAAVARNTGAAAATGDVLVFIDADVLVLPDTLRRLAEALRPDAALSACFGSYTALPSPTNFASVYKNLVHHFTHQTAAPSAHTFWAGCGAIRAEIFREIGGFDESYEASSVEDIELGYRLTRAGYAVVLRKDVQVRHAKVYTLGRLIRSDFFDRAIPWTLLMARKNVFYADLNLRASNILSALLLVLGVPISLLAVIEFLPDHAWMWPVAVTAVYLYLNRAIFLFVLEQKGFCFCSVSLPCSRSPTFIRWWDLSSGFCCTSGRFFISRPPCWRSAPITRRSPSWTGSVRGSARRRGEDFDRFASGGARRVSRGVAVLFSRGVRPPRPRFRLVGAVPIAFFPRDISAVRGGSGRSEGNFPRRDRRVVLSFSRGQSA
ncbi:MAG: glycosyltransferase [Deltaproteobacteria bacterium]|nr:glycosyltransferase [Deltaproteobacteria bacterium]